MDIKINNQSKLEIFSSIFHNIKCLTENVNIYFSDERMYIQTLDSSKTSILEINIPSSWFDYYSCDNDKCHIGINTNIFDKILSSRDKSQSIHFEYDNGKDILLVNMINIENEINNINESKNIDQKNKNIYNRYFEIPLVDLNDEMMNIPETDYEAEISIPSTNLAILIHQLKVFGDVLNIQCNEDNIQFISKSIESGSMRVEIKIEELNGFSIIENENINISFGLQHLNTICNYCKISKNAELKIRRDYPIRIEYIFGDSGEGSIRYFLAPKINDDE